MDNELSTSQKKALITGANSGLGFETALKLVEEGYFVIMACRNLPKGEKAISKIKMRYPEAELDLIQIDLSDFASVKMAANKVLKRYNSLNVLINNAGIILPKRQITNDGNEMHLQVNFLGHFLLTGLLLPLLLQLPGSRIISLSSIAHKIGEINFEDINLNHNYTSKKAYSQSKLACLMFAYHLDRKLKAKNCNVLSVAVHPGVSTTALDQYLSKKIQHFIKLVAPFLFQKPHKGALPLVNAVLNSEIEGGEYLGPDGLWEFKGQPTLVESNDVSHDTAIATELWQRAEKLTGITYP